MQTLPQTEVRAMCAVHTCAYFHQPCACDSYMKCGAHAHVLISTSHVHVTIYMKCGAMSTMYACAYFSTMCM